MTTGPGDLRHLWVDAAAESDGDPYAGKAAEADPPDPNGIVDGAGVTQSQLDAYLDWAGRQPEAEPGG